MAKKKQFEPGGTATNAQMIADQAVTLAGYATRAYRLANELGIKTKPIQEFPLDENDRAIVAEIPSLPASLKNKLGKKDAGLTFVDVFSFLMAVSKSFVEAESKQQAALLLVAEKLMDCLQVSIITSHK